MKRKLVLPAGAAVAVVAAVVVALSHLGPAPQTSADNASQLMDMVLCEGAGGYNDPLCPPAATTSGDGDGIIEVGENPAVVTRLLIDPPYSDYDQPLFFVAYSTWTGLVPGVGFTDGAIVGKADLTIQSNLIAPGSSNVSALTGQPPICDAEGAVPGTTLEDTFNLYDADVEMGTVVATTDENGSGFADDQEDLLDATGAPGPNGLLDGSDLMPDRLALDVIPKIQAATGAGAPIVRAFGVAELVRVAGIPVYRSVNYLTFVLPDGEYLGVTVVGYPGGARRECGDPTSNILEQTLLLCPPSDTRIYLYGITQDNTEACDTDGCAGSPAPSIPGGEMNRTAVWEGKFTYTTLIPTDANYDGDMAAGSFDTCTDTVSTDSDLPPYPKGETDPGDMGDRWDSSCDVAPASSDNDGDTQVSNAAPITGSLPNDPAYCNQPYATLCKWDCDQDVDGDTYLNTVDNCPTAPDVDVLNEDLDGNPATGVDWQLDSDGDTVGDICDPEPDIPGDGNGYFIDAHPHGLDTGGDPPGGAGFYHDHDFRCTDGFAIPGVEVEGDSHACEAVVDSGNDSRLDWEDLDDDGYFDVGEPVAVLSDSDSDDYTDGCEAVKDTDPLEPASMPGPTGTPGNCDGDSLSDAEEVAQGSDFSEPGVATVTPTPTGTPVWKPVAEAECTHRVVGGDPTEVDIVCHLSDEELDGLVYDWEIVYNDQVPTWPDPPQEPVECTLTDPDTGVQSPSSWTGLIIDMDGDSVVETAKCRDVAVADPWVVSECRDMHVRVAGDATIGSPMEIHLTDSAQNNIGVMESVESPDLPSDCSPPSTPTTTPTPESCPMDVVFLVDDTSSMAAPISQMVGAAANLVNAVVTTSGGDYQLGLVTFKDDVLVVDDLGPANASTVQASLAGLAASGGGAVPEASDEALNTAINSLPARPHQTGNFNGVWRASPAVKKMAFLITDAPPGGFNDLYETVDVINAWSWALGADAARILIFPIFVPGGSYYDETLDIMQMYATTTSSVFVETDGSGSRAAHAIQRTIEACGSPIEITGRVSTDLEGRPVLHNIWPDKEHVIKKRLGAPDGIDSAYFTLGNASHSLNGWMTYVGDGYWSISVMIPRDWGGIHTITIVGYKDGSPVDTESIEVVLTDPSGLILDSCTLAGIEGASATLYYYDPDLETFVVMDPVTYAGMLSPEVNPQPTDGGGYYAWDVVDGDYYVQATASGYDVVDSPTVTVPPPVTDLDILLTPLTPPDSDGDTLDDCVDTDDDNDGLSDSEEFNTHGTDPLTVDTDGDGCADSEELPGAPAPKPGSTGAYDPLAWYDVFDVPVPSRVDPNANGPRNGVVDISDVLAVLFYAFAEPTGICGDNPNANGLDYDCNKGVDTDGDTVADIPPDGVPDGRDYDRSASAEPNPPWEAGEPNGIVDIGDVLAVLAQAFAVDCSGPP